MIGEDKELEKDGWLISSIKTSSSGSDEWKKDTLLYEESGFKDKDYYTLLSIITYLAPEVKLYKSKGLLGEGLNGLLQKPNIVLSKNVLEEYSSTEKKTRILSELNSEKSKSEDINKIKERIILTNYNNAESGEYLEVTKGKWSKK